MTAHAWGTGPVARHTDPETSHEAAASVDHITLTRRRILNILDGFGACTDEQMFTLARSAGWVVSPSGLRTRRHELVVAGLVRDSGERTVTAAGRRTILWELVPEG